MSACAHRTENMYQLTEDMSHLSIPSLAVFTERARGLYEDNLSGYIRLLLRRSFGRLMVRCLCGLPRLQLIVKDFFDGVNKLLQTTPASEVSLHANFSKSALKKVLKDFGAKDMRKAIEAMSKRVDKHFLSDDDPSAANAGDAAAAQQLAQTVWREVTSELKREVERASGIIKMSYGDSGLTLEYGTGDVEAACKRARG